MTSAGIARYATTIEDVTALPVGTILVSADGVCLRREDPTFCGRPPCQFDTCPGCRDWHVLRSVDDHNHVAYASDQIFAEEGSRELCRVPCWVDNRSAGPHQERRKVHALAAPFLVAYIPPLTTPKAVA